MLTALHLGNFKAFGETQTIPLRPLTLIFGPNSSGKSSILHALLFAHEANRTGNLDVQRTQLGGDSVDLGGYPQFVYRHGEEAEWGVELDVRHLPQPSIEVFGPVDKVRVRVTIGSNAFLYSYTIETDGQPLLSTQSAEGLGLKPHPRGIRARMKISLEGVDQLRFIDHTHPVFRQISVQQPSHPARATSEGTRLRILAAAAKGLMGRAAPQLGGLLPKGVIVRSAASTSADKRAVHSRKKRPPPDEFTVAVQSTLLQLLDDLVRRLSAAVESELNRLIYLGPLRSYPPRHVAFDQYHDPNWQAGGGHAYDIARRDPRVQEEVNKWLGHERMDTRYKLHVARLLPPAELHENIYRIAWDLARCREDLASWSIEDFEGQLRAGFEQKTHEEWEGFDRSIPHFMWLFDERSRTFVSHRDVGIGISQVLPVLVHAFASQSRIIAIEQPEIHLHPKLQAELADVFIESALGERKNMFILETHSEHLILRVLRRIRETAAGELPVGLTPIRPEDVAVLYVSPTAEGSKVTEIPIRPDGEFAAPWPDGFFPDRAKELF